ncbi:MAG: bifunctional folylpolyglutamate synthase/dihydrofolate synthase [Nitrospiraceae bacterium]|nr:MAG: bifunctional folylpolyglutamate synthase/dihydrofolate synthase [Nitrospiraceae bacterium]
MTCSSEKYNKTVRYLYRLQKHGIKLGLANTLKIMSILGNPHQSFHSVHVAGTNGKGSTSAAIASILKENGFRVGLFTSPHLVSFTERIRINNIRIEESEVIETASYIHDAIKGKDLTPTFFEFVTAMAFYYFTRKKVDWAVVETGMGGRLDATNVIQPHVSIITNIGLDHAEFLGNTLSAITSEKAGIIKPGIPVITSSGLPDVVDQLSDTAKSLGSAIHVYGRDFSGSLLGMDTGQIIFDYAGHKNYNNLSMSLTGKYQLFNACTAIRACEVLREKGISISDTSIEKGLAGIKLEGRLEWVSKSPPILIDGAHNPDAARSLADSISELFPDNKIILIAGIMDDKDIQGILSPLFGIAESVILTRPGYERAASPEKLRELALCMQKTGSQPAAASVTISQTVSEALELAKKNCREDNIILVTGSFYTTGEVKEILSGAPGVLTQLRETMK